MVEWIPFLVIALFLIVGSLFRLFDLLKRLNSEVDNLKESLELNCLFKDRQNAEVAVLRDKLTGLESSPIWLDLQGEQRARDRCAEHYAQLKQIFGLDSATATPVWIAPFTLTREEAEDLRSAYARARNYNQNEIESMYDGVLSKIDDVSVGLSDMRETLKAWGVGVSAAVGAEVDTLQATCPARELRRLLRLYMDTPTVDPRHLLLTDPSKRETAFDNAHKMLPETIVYNLSDIVYNVSDISRGQIDKVLFGHRSYQQNFPHRRALKILCSGHPLSPITTMIFDPKQASYFGHGLMNWAKNLPPEESGRTIRLLRSGFVSALFKNCTSSRGLERDAEDAQIAVAKAKSWLKEWLRFRSGWHNGFLPFLKELLGESVATALQAWVYATPMCEAAAKVDREERLERLELLALSTPADIETLGSEERDEWDALLGNLAEALLHKTGETAGCWWKCISDRSSVRLKFKEHQLVSGDGGSRSGAIGLQGA